MAIKDWFTRKDANPTETTKAAMTTRDLVSMVQDIGGLNGGSVADFDYSLNIRAAYLNNPVSAYCLELIRTTAASAKWEVYDGEGQEVLSGRSQAGAIARLVSRPNPTQSWNKFIQLYVTHRLLAGEAFIYRLPTSSAVRRGNGELWLIEPNTVTITKTHYHIQPESGQAFSVPLVNQDGTHDIWHVKDWHPSSDRGLSRLAPAWSSINSYNQAMSWNNSVFSNSAKLSLVAIIKNFTGQAAKGGTPATQQARDIHDDLSTFATASGRGRPLVLGGDIELQEFGLNQQELEFIKGMEHMARNIAISFGVDPVLLGLPGDTAYNNKKQALNSLFKLTVLPLLDELSEELQVWLREIVDGDWRFELDLDSVPALEEDRSSLWARQATAADILTVDERRALLGYEPLTAELNNANEDNTDDTDPAE